MRYFYIILLTITYLASFSQESKEINWMTWDEMVKTRAKDSVKKKIFIDFTTDWCGWCKKMDNTTFKDPNVVAYMNQKFYAVKFDAEMTDTIVFNGHTFTNSEPNYEKPHAKARGRVHWFAYSLLDGAMSYPTYSILDENFTRLVIYPGFKGQEELLGILVFFASNQYMQYHNYLNKIWNQSVNDEGEK